jgi:hypothetical protein
MMLLSINFNCDYNKNLKIHANVANVTEIEFRDHDKFYTIVSIVAIVIAQHN